MSNSTIGSKHMTTATSYIYDIVSQMSDGQVETFHDVTWGEYEELLERIGETRHGLRISYNDGTLKVMSLSSEHEQIADFIKSLVVHIRLRFRMNILFFGSATMRKKKKSKGSEPDACFYVQTAKALGNRAKLDFTVDPPPDVVVEVDIHHDSTGGDPIYATLGAPEMWRYDGWKATIYHLQGCEYIEAEASNALPMITTAVLTEYLTRMREEGEFEAIIAFDEWLQSFPK
ncbi:MAG: Uma2 family endonuclease [Chloracidobacterium sp.]|nr:Uma2 family endonuclease [Chloracidobacterium sp.]